MHNPAFDRTKLSESERVRKYGGVLTSTPMIECLRHEARWDRLSKYPRATKAGGSAGGGGASSRASLASPGGEDELR